MGWKKLSFFCINPIYFLAQLYISISFVDLSGNVSVLQPVLCTLEGEIYQVISTCDKKEGTHQIWARNWTPSSQSVSVLEYYLHTILFSNILANLTPKTKEFVYHLSSLLLVLTKHTHTHTHINIYIFVCVCVCVCALQKKAQHDY